MKQANIQHIAPWDIFEASSHINENVPQPLTALSEAANLANYPEFQSLVKEKQTKPIEKWGQYIFQLHFIAVGLLDQSMDDKRLARIIGAAEKAILANKEPTQSH